MLTSFRSPRHPRRPAVPRTALASAGASGASAAGRCGLGGAGREGRARCARPGAQARGGPHAHAHARTHTWWPACVGPGCNRRARAHAPPRPPARAQWCRARTTGRSSCRACPRAPWTTWSSRCATTSCATSGRACGCGGGCVPPAPPRPASTRPEHRRPRPAARTRHAPRCPHPTQNGLNKLVVPEGPNGNVSCISKETNWCVQAQGLPQALLPRSVLPQCATRPWRPPRLHARSDEEDEPTSKEGSAPNENENNGSNGHGSNGSDEGNGTSRCARVRAHTCPACLQCYAVARAPGVALQHRSTWRPPPGARAGWAPSRAACTRSTTATARAPTRPASTTATATAPAPPCTTATPCTRWPTQRRARHPGRAWEGRAEPPTRGPAWHVSVGGEGAAAAQRQRPRCCCRHARCTLRPPAAPCIGSPALARARPSSLPPCTPLSTSPRPAAGTSPPYVCAAKLHVPNALRRGPAEPGAPHAQQNEACRASLQPVGALQGRKRPSAFRRLSPPDAAPGDAEDTASRRLHAEAGGARRHDQVRSAGAGGHAAAGGRGTGAGSSSVVCHCPRRSPHAPPPRALPPPTVSRCRRRRWSWAPTCSASRCRPLAPTGRSTRPPARMRGAAAGVARRRRRRRAPRRAATTRRPCRCACVRPRACACVCACVWGGAPLG